MKAITSSTIQIIDVPGMAVHIVAILLVVALVLTLDFALHSLIHKHNRKARKITASILIPAILIAGTMVYAVGMFDSAILCQYDWRSLSTVVGMSGFIVFAAKYVGVKKVHKSSSHPIDSPNEIG